MPVLTIEEVSHAVPVTAALIRGGLDVIEVTLRTSAALECIDAIARADMGCIIGAGTVLTVEDVAAAQAAGAQFLVTPGSPDKLVAKLKTFNGAVIPGASNPTQAMNLYDLGFDFQKFFPAEPAGGAPYIKALHGPLPNIDFMPTGGIRIDTVETYLQLPNVIAIGGSWIAPPDIMRSKDWNEIQSRAQRAFEIRLAISENDASDND